MGLGGLIKRTASKAKGAADDFADAVKNAPEATVSFANRAADNVRAEANVQGSIQQKFSDAPLGLTAFVPDSLGGKQVRKIGSYVAPSPRQFVEHNEDAAKHPSVGSIARAGLDDVAVATLPLAGADVVKGARGGFGIARDVVAGQDALRGAEVPLADRFRLARTVGKAARQGADVLYHGTNAAAANAIETEGFKASSRFGRQVFATNDVRVASQYARDAAARTGENPAIVALKAAAGKAPAHVQGKYQTVFNDLKDVEPLQQFSSKVTDIASKQGMVDRIRGTLRAEMEAAAARGARQKQLAGKIGAVREELQRMGGVTRETGKVIPFVARKR